MNDHQLVLVTTQHCGSFVGYIPKPLYLNEVMRENQHCHYGITLLMYHVRYVSPRPNYASTVNHYDLATVGPNRYWSIGDAMETIGLTHVTSIVPCSPQAVQAWKAWENGE